jgi:hypothetical protein
MSTLLHISLDVAWQHFKTISKIKLPPGDQDFERHSCMTHLYAQYQPMDLENLLKPGKACC